MFVWQHKLTDGGLSVKFSWSTNSRIRFNEWGWSLSSTLARREKSSRLQTILHLISHPFYFSWAISRSLKAKPIQILKYLRLSASIFWPGGNSRKLTFSIRRLEIQDPNLAQVSIILECHMLPSVHSNDSPSSYFYFYSFYTQKRAFVNS